MTNGSVVAYFGRTPEPQEATDVVCPHFWELKWATGCPYSCAWCYLQGTLRLLPQRTAPYVKDYGRVQNELRRFFAHEGIEPSLLNAGELADSLMWESNGSPFSAFVIGLFRSQSRHRVLFVTKSDQ